MAKFWQDLGFMSSMDLTDKLLVGKNADGSTQYTDLQTVYNKISQVYFADTKPSVIAAGSVLTNPNSLTCHIAPAGTYTLPSGNVTLMGNINFLFWDFSAGWTWQSFDVGVKDGSVGTNSLIDNSITESKIAPLAVTKQKIKSKVVSVEKLSFVNSGKNLFDKNNIVLGEYIQGVSNGIILTSSTSPTAPSGSIRAGRIYVLPNTQYTLSGLTWSSIAPWIRFEKEDNTLISQEQITYTSSKYTFTTPAECYYLTFSVGRDSNGMSYTLCQLELGGTATIFEDFKIIAQNLEAQKIADAIVTEQKIAALAVTESKIAPLSVTKQKIMSKVVSVEKLSFVNSGKNLFDKNNVVFGEYIQGVSNGIILTSSTSPTAPSGSIRAGRIYVSPNTQYTLSGLTWSSIAPWIRFEKEDNTLISQEQITYTSSKYTFTTPAECYYLTFSVGRDSNGMSYTLCQLELGGTATIFEDFKIIAQNLEAQKIADAIVTEQKIAALAVTESKIAPLSVTNTKIKNAIIPQKLAIINSGKNLFDKNNVVFGEYIQGVSNGIILTSSTSPTAPSGSIRAGRIYVSPNTQYTLSGLTWSSIAPWIRFEKEDNTLISQEQITYTSSKYTFTTPAECYYLTFSVGRDSNGMSYTLCQLELGGTATIFEDFNQKIYQKHIDTEETLTLIDCDKIAISGCSYIEGAGVAVKNKALVNRISGLSNYLFQNWGIGGDRTVDITDRFRKNTASPYTSRGFGISDVKPKFITVNNIGNETVNKGGIDSQLYLEEVKEFVKVIENIGAKPIFATDWFTGNPLLTSVIADFAKKQKSVFHDIGSLGEKILTQGSPSFRWWGTHPDTRNNSHNVSEWIYLINSLPKPEKSIKIFRKRSEFAPDSINSLNYDSLTQRYQKFVEIQIGHKGLNDITGATYTDRSSSASSYSQSYTYIDEYMELMAKQPISFTNYALFDITLPKIRNKSVKVYIKTAQNAGFNFYAKDYSNVADWANNSKTNEAVICVVDKTTYDNLTINVGDIYTSPQVLNGSSASINLVMKGKLYHPSVGYIVGLETQGKVSPTTKTLDLAATLTRTTGTGTSSISYTKIDSTLTRHSFEFITGLNKPEGSFANLSSFVTYDTVLGYYVITLSETEIKKYFSYDNLKLIANLTGSFNVFDVYVKYDGGDKKEVQTFDYQTKKSYTSLILDKTFDASWTTARWNNNGCTLGQISTTHRDYPNLISPANQHVALTFGTDNTPNSISRTLNFTANGSTRKAVIRTIARVFPKFFREDLGTNDTETTTTRQITADSYDEGTICVGLKGNNIVNVLKHRVDIGWHEQYFEIDIPAFCSTLELSLYRDFDDIISSSYRNHLYEMQVCYVSFEIE